MPDAKMWLVPDWAPNLHPMVVHFPVALLSVAVLVDLAALMLRRPPVLTQGAAGLYALGAITLVATYLTGRDAAGTVFTPGMAHAVVASHWNWAMWTTLYFLALTVGRIAWHGRLGRGGPGVSSLLAVAGVAGLFLLTQTAERGARLVYEFGVGVVRVP